MVFVHKPGLRLFSTVWIGQLISQVGSGLTGFALALWVLQETGSATSYALVYLAGEVPALLISPMAGAMVDRHDRRLVMLISDTVAALSTLSLALALIMTGELSMGHVYLVAIIISLSSAFQVPAYLSAVPTLVTPDHLHRANGMLQFTQATRMVLVPLLAAFLVATIQLQGVILIDVATFIVGVALLLMVQFPRPAAKSPGEARRSLWQEAAEGWRYIQAHAGLLALLVVFGVYYFLQGIMAILIAPMILAFASLEVYGSLVSIGGVGMLLASAAMSAWSGSPGRRVSSVLGFLFLAGFFLALHGLRPSVPLLALVVFGFFFTLPFINGSSTIIWQTKVPLHMQGRVFATQQMLARSTAPFGRLLAGPLADYGFEPLLLAGGPLAGSVGRVIGVGAGRGIALIFILGGLAIMLVAAAGYAHPRLRLLEAEIPDTIVES